MNLALLLPCLILLAAPGPESAFAEEEGGKEQRHSPQAGSAASPTSLRATHPAPRDFESIAAWGLKDHCGERFEIAEDTRWLVFVIGDRHISEATERWGNELAEELPKGTQLVRLLDLNDVPSLGLPMVRRAIRRQVGEAPISIVLDWDSRVARAFGVPASEPVILVSAPNGEVVLEARGAWSEERAAELMRGLRDLTDSALDSGAATLSDDSSAGAR